VSHRGACVLRNVSFRRSAGIRIRRNADGASERAQRQLATRLSRSKPSGRRSAVGQEEQLPPPRSSGRCGFRKRSVAIDNWRRRLLSQVLSAELGAKRLELLHEVIPTASKIAFLVNPTAPIAESLTRDMQERGSHPWGYSSTSCTQAPNMGEMLQVSSRRRASARPSMPRPLAIVPIPDK
jgi:hypothetical protein